MHAYMAVQDRVWKFGDETKRDEATRSVLPDVGENCTAGQASWEGERRDMRPVCWSHVFLSVVRQRTVMWWECYSGLGWDGKI